METLPRNPSFLIALRDAPFKKRAIIYERALKALPGSYKLWYAYLRERLEIVRNLPITHSQYQTLNNTFEWALATMHKMPRIWIMFLQALTHQKLITRTRRTFDRALCALPVTQHDRIWECYLVFASQKFVPIQTSLRVYNRYLKHDPSHIEDFIEFLINSKSWQEAAERLAGVLNDDQIYSIKGKTKHRLWLDLCDLLTQHANEVSGLNVDAIIRGGIRKFTDEVGYLWTSLADYYIRRGLLEKARDVFEEGMATVITVREFSVIFDAYSQFQDTVLSIKMENMDDSDEDGNEDNRDDDEEDYRLDIEKLGKTIGCFWLKDDKDVNMQLASNEHLMDRRPELANSVLLRQNPHNVEQWHRRVKLFEGNPTKQILTYTEAVRTVDPIMKAVGKPHTLWLAFAMLYETHGDVSNARVIFDKAVQVNYKAVDHLASIWCEWAEMEIRHKNLKGALELMRRATAEPSVEVKRRVADDQNEPVQMKLHKSLKLWTFYVDLEESLGSIESARAVYERILDLKIATPQIIINYGMLLQEHNYFEDSFKVYERGVKIFKYPHAKDIWVTYLSKFVQRYGKSKLERAREIFDKAVQEAPAESVEPLYLQYAKLEEDYGLSKRAMQVYDQGVKAVPDKEKLAMYEIYIARAAHVYGLSKTREIYEQAIESQQLTDKDVKLMCLRYAELEKNLGEVDRGRALYKYASRFADPRSDADFWNKWHEFEVQHGNEDTFREMLQIRRNVSASYSQAHFILPEDLMPKDQMETLDEAKDVVKKAGVADDDMAALERQLLPTGNDTSATEYMELPEESESEYEEKVEIAEKKVPDAVFGGLGRKRDKADTGGGLGALDRIKRMRLEFC